MKTLYVFGEIPGQRVPVPHISGQSRRRAAGLREKPCAYHGVGAVECQRLSKESRQAGVGNLSRLRKPS